MNYNMDISSQPKPQVLIDDLLCTSLDPQWDSLKIKLKLINLILLDFNEVHEANKK